MMGRFYQNGLLPALGGICILAVVMGIGRFVYTALLPAMMEAYQFNEKVAGIMAAWNYGGYLLGVLVMRKAQAGTKRYWQLAFFLALSVLSTAGMGLIESVPLFYTMRFISGVASGGAFVLGSSLVLDTLMAVKRPSLGGLFFSGVGIGIALGGLSVQSLESLLGIKGVWIMLGLLCLLPVLLALYCLRPQVTQVLIANNEDLFTQDSGTSQQSGEDARKKHEYGLLLIAYFLEGFGYIIGMTFLVVMIKDVTQSISLANHIWVITGCAAAVSAPLWRYAVRHNFLPALICAFLLQAVGVLLPAISSAPAVALAGGVLLGGTFIGITVLSLQYGISISGRSSAHTIAMLTVVYGVGQIIGPFVAGWGAQGQGFVVAFMLSSLSLFVAAGLLVFSYVLRKRVG